MSDPVPSAAAHPESGSHPANAEDRKAAAALSSLRPNEIGTEASSTGGPSGADQEALGKAMSRLDIAGGQKNGAQAKKVVKITAADVAFLAEQLDLHKNKATDLLRANDGDVVLAMRAFISPA